MTKSNSPRMLPCSTPGVTRDHAEATPSLLSFIKVVLKPRLYRAFLVCNEECRDLVSRILSKNPSITHLLGFYPDFCQYRAVHLETGLCMINFSRSHIGLY